MLVTQSICAILWEQRFDTRDSRNTTSTLRMAVDITMVDDEIRLTPYLIMRVDENVSDKSWQRLKEKMLRCGGVAAPRGRRAVRILVSDDPWSAKHRTILRDPFLAAFIFERREYFIAYEDMIQRSRVLASSTPHLMMLVRTIGGVGAPDGGVVEDVSLLRTLWAGCYTTTPTRDMVSNLRGEMSRDPDHFDEVLTTLTRVRCIRCSWMTEDM